MRTRNEHIIEDIDDVSISVYNKNDWNATEAHRWPEITCPWIPICYITAYLKSKTVTCK